jgi:dihydrodipicolinate synthase/N-acetylneuraminate lyase
LNAALPKGIITVINTPFTAENQIDHAALQRNVRRATAAGVAGFLVPALAAEVYQLSRDERTRMVETVIQTTRTDGQLIPVVGSATARTEEDRQWHAHQLTSLGCGAVLVALDPDSSEDRIVDELRALSDGGSTRLILQDWAPSGPGFSLGLIDRIARDLPEVIGLKIEVVPSGPKFTAIREATGDRFHLSGGWTVLQMIEAYDRGVDAFMPTALHEIYVAIDRLYRAGRRNQAVELFHQLTPILAFSNQHLETSIHFFKRLLAAEGTYSTAHCRTAVTNFDSYHAKIATDLIAYAISLREHAPDPTGET